MTTYNYAAGDDVYHQKKVGGIWQTYDFGDNLQPLTRYWYAYYNVQGWLVNGEIQQNESSGVFCGL